MRSILFLSIMNGSHWGGSEEAWYRTALWMARNHYRVGIGCYDWREKQHRIDALQEAGCEVYLLPNRKGLFKKPAIKKALDKIPFNAYDLVVVNQGGWEEILHSPFKDLYKKLTNYVLVNHNYNEQAVLSFSRQKLLQQWISKAKMNFGATLQIFDVMEKHFNMVIDKKQTLINPVTFETESHASLYPNTDGACTWIMLAELDIARKAQDVLIETLAAAKWKSRNWTLHLYGRGKDVAMLEKLITEKGLSEKIFLKGFTNDVKQTLKDCHLLLQCTRIDAMPLSVVEAMAMGRPCVVSEVGDMPVWVEDHVNGFTCKGVTTEAVDEALERCWQQKENWRSMGQNAFNTFQKKYPQPYEAKTADILISYIK
jgi:glycosyltransferase involved in cell wall biosynthesis